MMLTTATIQLLPLTTEHYPAVSAIYAEGIATGQATFATDVPAWAEWDASHLPHSRVVALSEAGQVAGWAALTPVSGRCVYRGVAEVSVYVGAAHRGRGVGQRLLAQLVAESEQHGIWTLQAGIMRLNAASLRLHEQAGFRLVGVRERLGQLQGQWHDVCLLERRSRVVG
ncbi:GNAT family N-acetyltransferase [Hymenobacter sublimis]|uniref:N-acetyltransferase family protein n=1 Tax=Hymenobacter sublimis TaxID=2933777 RepID=A0ABY4JBF5_9BACT|nr:GNAT family N-acetyltransferase [Hymenobacter sublimis]UPL50153.1 N-acetyltransferase family protein [Hymenobacter sublimis]